MVASEKLPPHLLEVLERQLGRKPTLWIGEGVSGQANPPLPTLRQLAEGMREAPIGWKKMPEVEEPYAAFERGLEQRIYRKSELRSYLEHRLRPDGQDSQPGPLHHHLASLAWAQTFPFIVDTNYDLLLRRAMQELRAPHTHSSLERNLKRPGQGCWYLSIYGDMTDWSEIVLTSEGQTPFEDRYRFLKGQLDLLLARHPVLFVGCSMLDPRLLEWVDGLTEAQREELNTWVALMSPGEAEALDEPLHDGRTARERYGDVLQVLELPSVEMLPRVFQAAAAEAVAEREQSEGELCITIHAEEARWRIEAAGHEHDVDPPDLKEMLTLLRKCAGQGLPCDERGAYVDQSSVAVESQMQQLAKSVGQALTELLPPAGLEVLQALAARSAGQDAALVRIQVHGDDKAANNALVLPWELLMLGDRFPVARGEVHIVREAVVPGLTEDQNRRGTLPRLSVVAHVAAPKGPGLPELNLEEASYRMSRALLEVEGQALFTEMGTLEDLREAAKRVSAVDRASKVDGESAVVLHFAGHGIPGQLVFENNDGGPDEVPAKRLLETLRDAMGKLPEAIWLSCCYGAGSGKPASEDDRAREWGGAGADSPSIAADLHRAGIPQILGYFGPVPDPLAVAVDRRLFEGLAETGSTLDAVRKARLRTQRPIDTRKGWARFPLSWTLLSLYHRGPNVPLVDVDQPPPPELERHLLEPGAEKLYGLKDLGLGFIGRRRLLARLRQERRKGERVLGLFGLGGLGKTATMMKVARVLLTDTQTKGGPSWQDRALMLPLQHLDGQEQLHADPFSVLREFVNQTVLAHPSCPADWSARLDAIERDEGPASRGRALAQLVRSVGRGGVLYIDNGETMQVERAAMDGARDRVPWRSAEVAEFFQAICEAVPSDTTVLLTTRYQPAETEGKWIPIEPCSEGEMLRMTRWHRWLKALPPVLREELVSGRMEGHPRAVEWTNELVGQQAARWEEQTGLSLTGSSVDTIRREVLEPALAGLPERAGADLLLETLLERQRPEALVLLGECCGIGLPVPLDVVRRMGDGADALRSRGLLTSMQEQRWGVHPFVREVVERRTDGPPWSKAGRAVLVEYWDEVCSEGAPEASHRELLEQALAAELWAKARATVATLSEAFRRRGWAKARLELIEGVTKQPWSDAERGWLLNRLSDALDSMGRYEEAERAIRKSLKLSEHVHGTREHYSVASSLHGLANVLGSLGRYEEAKEVYEESISILKRVYGAREHGWVASSLHGLANVLVHLGRYEEAKEVYEESISILKRVYRTREHGDVAASLSGLANVLESLGRYEEAKEVYEESISIQERVYGTREHGDVAASLSGLANVLGSLGRYEEAKEVYEESIPIKERVYGTREHGSVASSLHGLANALVRLGRYEEAKEVYEESISIQEGVYGTRGHGDVAASLHGLANVLDSLGRYEEAKEVYKESISIKEGVYGTREHGDVAASLHGLANVLEHLGRYEEAKEVYEESISTQERVYGLREHGSVASSLHGLANVLVRLDRYEEAERAFREVLAIEERAFGSRRTPASILTLVVLAELLVQQQRPHDALPLAQDGWDGALEHNSLLDAVQAGPVYVATLAMTGQEEEARQVLATVVRLLQQLPEDHPVRVSVERQIGLRQ